MRGFAETPGGGIEASIDSHEIRLGSARWLSLQGLDVPDAKPGEVGLAIDGRYRGTFRFRHGVRPAIAGFLKCLAPRYELALLSGDTDRERDTFTPLFGADACMRFRQSPLDKLEFVESRQGEGKIVMMVGDGLNDAGALQQSDVGVAVMENLNGFFPRERRNRRAGASLVKMDAALKFSRATAQVVQTAFGISAIYNVVGLSIAARGLLSPLTCAILMPLSSISVVGFACGVTLLLSRSFGLSTAKSTDQSGGKQ